MKKIFAALAVSTLLFGCNFGSGPADPSENPPADEPTVPTDVALTDALFIDLSAQILCLPANNPTDSSADIETKAQQILAEVGVAADAFGTYQKTIEADPTSKKEISLAIVGKMSDYCEIKTSAGDSAQTDSTTATEQTTTTSSSENSTAPAADSTETPAQ
ncbi:MAG: hypothetical protein V2A63_01730 [Patescibacteria group bacterium]